MDKDTADGDRQREDHDKLRFEHGTRGSDRASHLEAGRERARSENGQARDRASSQLEHGEVEEAWSQMLREAAGRA
jgi:hypothetical protein